MPLMTGGLIHEYGLAAREPDFRTPHVLVKPNGLLGTGYMAAIKPFRHLIVYPAIMHEVERAWRASAG
jgi:Protein of unknown function (DUF2867)